MVYLTPLCWRYQSLPINYQYRTVMWNTKCGRFFSYQIWWLWYYYFTHKNWSLKFGDPDISKLMLWHILSMTTNLHHPCVWFLIRIPVEVSEGVYHFGNYCLKFRGNLISMVRVFPVRFHILVSFQVFVKIIHAYTLIPAIKQLFVTLV